MVKRGNSARTDSDQEEDKFPLIYLILLIINWAGDGTNYSKWKESNDWVSGKKRDTPCEYVQLKST